MGDGHGLASQFTVYSYDRHGRAKVAILLLLEGYLADNPLNIVQVTGR